MKIFIDGEKTEGIFIRRLNRFLAEILVDNEIQLCHVPNTGRMKELLIEGVRIIVRRIASDHRKTQWDLLMVYKNDIIVNIDSLLPNKLLEKAFLKGAIPQYKMYNNIKREVKYKRSKFDFSLSNERDNVLIEAKCVTLVKENNLATFPDAPTDRGRKHLLELIDAKKEGIHGGVFFIIQREDAEVFTPNLEMDKDFYDLAVKAKREGISFFAYNCKVTCHYIELNKRIPVVL